MRYVTVSSSTGPRPSCEDLLLAAEGVDHRQRIVAVDALGMHLFGVDARADARDELHAHGLAAAAGRPCHRSCSCS